VKKSVGFPQMGQLSFVFFELIWETIARRVRFCTWHQ
jgi:hypothetical protein